MRIIERRNENGIQNKARGRGSKSTKGKHGREVFRSHRELRLGSRDCSQKYDEEFQLVEVKNCQDCGQIWCSMDIYIGSPRETCPDCKVASQDKFLAETKQVKQKAEYESQRFAAYN